MSTKKLLSMECSSLSACEGRIMKVSHPTIIKLTSEGVLQLGCRNIVSVKAFCMKCERNTPTEYESSTPFCSYCGNWRYTEALTNGCD